MTYLLAKATVENFEAWKSSFDGNESFRTEHGELGFQRFQSTDDPNEVVVLFEWDDDADPRAFFRSEAMRERMAEAGVAGIPEMEPLEMIDQQSAIEPAP